MAKNFGVMKFARGEVIAFDILVKDLDGAPDTDAATIVEVVISESRGSAVLVQASTGDGVEVEAQSEGKHRAVIPAGDVSSLTDGTAYSLVAWSNHGTGDAILQVYGFLIIEAETEPT